jgi:hypothetical protein
VTRIFGEDDLVAFLSGSDLLPKGDIPADLLAERCIVQEMLQVDGIATPDGVTCWPSAVSSNLEARFGRPIYNAMLDRDDPLFEPLRDLVRRTIEVLPTPENTIFHAEIFRDEAGRLLLNEIACRMGGGRNKDSLKAAFGVDLVELQVKAQLKGIPVGDALAEPARMCGWLLIPPARGRLLRIPGECPVAGIVDYRAEARPGDVLHGPTSCESRVASFIAAGATRAEVEAALRRAHDWFADAVAYGDAAEPATP